MEQEDDREQPDGRKSPGTHRATYILEFGTWKATCRTCGWTVRDAQRRQAASRFRMHIRDARLLDLAGAAGPGNDLPVLDSLDSGLTGVGLEPPAGRRLRLTN